MLDHGRELQLVTGTRFMRGERPGCSGKCEVVVLQRLSICARGSGRKNELAPLSMVVEETRRAAYGARAAERFLQPWQGG